MHGSKFTERRHLSSAPPGDLGGSLAGERSWEEGSARNGHGTRHPSSSPLSSNPGNFRRHPNRYPSLRAIFPGGRRDSQGWCDQCSTGGMMPKGVAGGGVSWTDLIATRTVLQRVGRSRRSLKSWKRDRVGGGKRRKVPHSGLKYCSGRRDRNDEDANIVALFARERRLGVLL